MSDSRARKIRIEPRVVILFLALLIPPLILGPIVLFTSARYAYHEITGKHLSEMAQFSQLSLTQYLRQIGTSLAVCARVPQVREAVLKSNRLKLDKRQREDVEVNWTSITPESSVFLRSLLENDAARFLRTVRGAAPAFNQLILTDETGRVAAATDKPKDYFLGDERWWRYGFKEGVGGGFVGNLSFNEASGIYTMDLAEPLIDSSTGKLIGVLKATVSADTLLQLVNEIDFDGRGEAILLGSDGKIIASREATIRDQRSYPFYGAVQEGIDASRRFTEGGEGANEVIIGLPSFRFKDQFPGLDWVMVAELPCTEAFAPLQQMNRWFLFIVLFAFLMVLGSAAAFSWMLSKPVVEIDPHLERV